MLKGLWQKKKSCLKVETIIVLMLAIQPPKNKIEKFQPLPTKIVKFRKKINDKHVLTIVNIRFQRLNDFL